MAALRGTKLSLLEIWRLMASGEDFDSLGFALATLRDYGGISYHEFGPVRMVYIVEPDLIHEVLVTKADKFHKGQPTRRGFGLFLGNGLLLSEGEFWKRQRKLAQPAFHAKRIEGYADTIVRYAEQLTESLQHGQTVEFSHEMMKLTLNIVSKTLFDADVSQDAERVGVLLTDVLEASNRRINSTGMLPDWVPTPEVRRTRRAMRELDAIIQRFIDDRRRSGEDKGDLLSMLLLARDEDGRAMDDKQLRDEVMTLFLAGHETTAMALTWAWYLLGTYPQALSALQQEVDRVLDGRTPTMADLPNLPYTELVVKEAMRLYPPAPGVSREPIEDVTIGEHPIKKGTMIAISFYAMHRDPRWFENPSEFIPERFEKSREAQIPRYAYLPFGAGPRVCIGNSFAMLEARLALTVMAQRVSMELTPGQQVEPQQLVTVRPKHGVSMRLLQRSMEPAAR